MLQIVGYTDRMSVRPGEKIAVKVSCEGGAADYQADIIRLICGDDSPAGPGFKAIPVPASINGRYPGRRQAVNAGSFVYVPGGVALDGKSGITVAALIWPTLLDKEENQTILSCRRSDGAGFAVALDAQGRVQFSISGGGRSAEVTAGAAVRQRCWYQLIATYDAAHGSLRVARRNLAPLPGEAAFVSGETAADIALPRLDRVPVTIGASLDRIQGERLFTAMHFDGKIEAPLIAGELVALDAGTAPDALHGRCLGRWDFARAIDSQHVEDVSGQGRHGRCVNLPTRAVTGHAWRGQTVRWLDRPDLYGAIHFHCDDLHDMQWETDFQWTIPADLPSGIYAVQLTCAHSGEDIVPFFVLPPKGRQRAKVAFLASTFTFLAYANSHHGYEDALSEVCYGALLELGPAELFLKERRDFGISLYDRHRDGSGACYSSWHRPILNTRPKRALWNFNADLHVVDWLHESGIDCDIVSDEHLHAEGVGLLSAYACVITGTHPEYHTAEMLDALAAYTDRGGRLMYLGGNGFYWRVAVHPDLPGVIEVRRGEAGTRCFELPPGERHHSFTGAAGGLWRSQGRAPQGLVGVGFVTEGFDANSHFVRLPDSFDRRAAFIFDGISATERIGDFGSLGGAAGYELDASDPELGTPPQALVLAKSVDHTNVYLLTPEEMLAGFPGNDAIENPRARGELVFYECHNGGAVFSTGSITWASALAHNGYDNNVARITGNVLRRFVDPAPF